MAAERVRWAGRPVQAAVLRGLIYLLPLAGSIVFVHFASQVIPAPAGSLWQFLSWWLGLSALATVVLILLDRLMRRLLPLAALLKLSLVFPDQAPSRFKVALRSGSVEHLQEKVATTSAAGSPSEAAARLLELVAALNIHDRLTRGHCERVRAYTVMIGEELGLSKDDLDLLNWAALLHDVGKLRVPTEILTKEGRPSDREWTVLRQHPSFGRSSSLRCGSGSVPGPRRSGSITNAGTARATRTGWQERRSRSPAGSSPSPTCSTS